MELPTEWVSEMTDAVQRELEERERWVTVEGLATLLACEPSHVYDLRQRGLPAHRLIGHAGRNSKKLYFKLSEVWAWFENESVLV